MDIKDRKTQKRMPIRDVREKLGLTRPQVRELVGIPERTLQHVEEGNPTSADVAYRLAKAYGISLEEAFEGLGYDVSEFSGGGG